MKRLLGLVVVLLISYVIVRPLLSAGYFPMHDDTQVARVVVMGRALREGQFPVRWVSDLGYGYGYPIFNFYGPLPYYVGGAIHAAGVSGLVATKIMMALGLVLAGVTMYLALSHMVGVSAGMVGAALYMFAPYHAVQAYVRGAVGEYWALVFLPLILWGFWRKNILVGALGIAGLVVSHTILGYAGMVFVLFAFLATKMQKQVLMLILLGLGLSAFFWLPAITEMKYTNVSSQVSATSDFRDHFVCLPQLWNSFWGYGGSAKGCLDGLSFKLGKVHLLLALIGLVAAFKKHKYFMFAGASIFLLSVFFMLPISVRAWEFIPLFAYIQYPWRFLAFALFGVSLIGSVAFSFVRQPILRWLTVLTGIGILLFVEAKRFMPQYTYERAAGDFETDSDIRFRASQISDEYLLPAVPRPAKEEEIFRDTIPRSDNYILGMEQDTDTYKKFTMRSGTDNTIVVRIAYFPGWHYIVNENVVYPKLENGFPELSVPAGFSVVRMQFRDTPVRTVGNFISMVSLGIYIYLYDRKNKKPVS